MAMNNHPDKFTLDAYSDPQLETYNPNGVYSRFTNRLTTPILNAKGVLLLNSNFVNPIMQLNDASQLQFFYYANASATAIATLANLKCIRLLPSSYVAPDGYTAFTKNKYWNTVTELTAALTAAAATGGDDVTYNPTWVAGQVTFSYDAQARRISVTGNGTTFIAPAAADDPNVLNLLRGTTTATNRIRMNTYLTNSGAYATAALQPYVEQISMNARLGFAMAYQSRGLYWGSSSQVGVATCCGIPKNLTTTPMIADANPILIGSQNVNVYTSITTGGGMDSLNGKNLLATIPLEVPALNVNSYTMSSVEKPSLSTPNEIYEITVEFRDDYGIPVPFPPSYNATLQVAVFY
jgi:hypothetical protein